MDGFDENALLDLLNSTPVIDGVVHDALGEREQAREWGRAHGGTGTGAEVEVLREVRGRLQDVVGGRLPATALEPFLRGACLVPHAGLGGVGWSLEVAEDRRAAATLVLTWGRLQEQLPDRLRPCANTECRLFLLDRSRANNARWCSMKVCGNRLKARRHHQRHRPEGPGSTVG